MANETPIKQISPKSLKKISRKKFNMSYGWFKVAFVFLIISAILFVCIILSGWIGKIIFVAILALLWYFFYTRLRNDELLENLRLTYQFYNRKKGGETLVSKYNEASTRLIMRFLGIVNITKALIEYEDKIFFCLIQYIPPRPCDDSKDEHNQNIVSLLKTLKDGVQYQFNMNTTTKYSGQYEAQILSAANGAGVPKPVKDHLFSVQKLINKSGTKVHPEFFFMCGLGTHTSTAKAQEAMDTMIKGLEYQFNSLGAHFRVLSSPEEITTMLYQKMTQGL
jgi:hypothetical protein